MFDHASEPTPSVVPTDDESSRRGILTNLLGIVAGTAAFAALTGCESSTPTAGLAGEDGDVDTLTSALKQSSSVIWLDQIGITPGGSSGSTQNLRSTVGTPGQIAVVQGFWSIGDGGGGIFCWDEPPPPVPPAPTPQPDPVRNKDNQGLYVVPNTIAGAESVNWGWRRLASGPLNVKWFGARDDGGDAPNTTKAIQAALDLAAGPQSPTGAGSAGGAGVIYFPSRAPNSVSDGTHVATYAINQSIKLPRNAYYSYIVFRGDGRGVVQIQASAGVDAFTAVQDTGNPSNGSYLFEHLAIAVQPGSRAFSWTVPGATNNTKRPEVHFNEMFFVTSNSTVDGLVFLNYGLRCRFYNCEFTGIATASKTAGGVAIRLDNSSASLINCRVLGTGALLNCVSSGELTIIGCQAGGGVGRPSFQFSGGSRITLISPEDQGAYQYPAGYQFTNCNMVLVMNPGIAGSANDAGLSGGPGWCDGIRFEGCASAQVIGGSTPYNSFAGVHTGTAMIRIDAACAGVQIRGAYSVSPADYVCLGKDCQVEMLSSGGVYSSGTLIGQSTVSSQPLTPTVGGVLYVDVGNTQNPSPLKYLDKNGQKWSVGLT